MYTRCIHCNGALGANEEVEHFTVGRRLAFDGERGRLWVVCPACSRWNLSPLEERWEAMEECERLWRDTPRRFSTDQIGLARLGSGLDLIRIGRPHRPEFAAWRYGSQFTRRRRKHLVGSVVGGAVERLTEESGMVFLFINPLAGVALFAGRAARHRYLAARRKQVVTRLAAPDGAPVEVTRGDLARVALAPSRDGEWAFTLDAKGRSLRLAGGDALRLGALTLAERNAPGATERQVRMAVDKLEWFRGPEGMVRFALRQGGLESLGYEQRLALEMALHEESERRALEGELAALEEAWREAEEIASISDDLLLPPTVLDWLRRRTPR
ncbi:MAG TPA: hypothetical protein VGE02_09640 [Gemmatimonadales bacterium]